MDTKHLSDDKAIIDCIIKIIELQNYFKSADKKSIKKALLEAKKMAPQEITALERKNNETQMVDLEKMPLQEVHRKIHQYQHGLKLHCLNKISEEKFEDYLKEYKKCRRII